jgi:hypothetical protein
VNAYAVALIIGAIIGYLYGWRRGLTLGAYEAWDGLREDDRPRDDA